MWGLNDVIMKLYLYLKCDINFEGYSNTCMVLRTNFYWEFKNFLYDTFFSN